MIKNSNKIYYKYRAAATENTDKFLKDIFHNKCLYASERKYLNDPMEGIFRVIDDINNSSISTKFMEAIRNVKGQYRICSFSKNPHGILLWSHYANSCSGIAIGFKLVEVPRNQQEKRNVNYVKDLISMDLKLSKNEDPEKLAKEILFSKLSDWKYEEEVRVLTKSDFVPIEIVEVILGPNIDKESEVYIKKLVKKYECENSTVIKIKKETIYDLRKSNNKIIMEH